MECCDETDFAGFPEVSMERYIEGRNEVEVFKEIKERKVDFWVESRAEVDRNKILLKQTGRQP